MSADGYQRTGWARLDQWAEHLAIPARVEIRLDADDTATAPPWRT